MRTSQVIQADGRGRLLLPKPLREGLGLGPHTEISVEECDDGTVVLRNARAARERLLDSLQGSLAREDAPIDEFHAERRRDAAAGE